MGIQMMTVPACNAHRKKGEQVPGTVRLAIGEREWMLCDEHAAKFGSLLGEALDGDEKTEEQVLKEEEQENRPAVVVAGKVEGYSAAEVRQAVESLGYAISGNVTSDTAYIIVGKRASNNEAKIAEAQAHDTPVINVEDPNVFRRLVIAGELQASGALPDTKGRAWA